jgi:class 3 adenylate cyclase
MGRRLVVVLFLDLVGWTRLAERVDPEPLQVLLERYYEICCARVEEHGGVVEKFIGDAIMAVFGTSVSQEDDALRALRTAFQIRADVGALRTPGGAPVEVHCGIAAGEALVTHSARAGIRVVGDVVNLAARLQSAATAGEVVVNDVVAHLARRHIIMQPLAPLQLKGKAEPVPAYLATDQAAMPDRTGDGPRLVNRDAERAHLRGAFDRVARERRSHAVAVLGPPGIGKTRLVRSIMDDLVAAGGTALTAVGTCPSYGANGSYLALVEVMDALIRQSASGRELAWADSHIAAVLSGLRDASRSRQGAATPGPGVEEISRATRELLAVAGATGPLVVVWDALEWAGPSLLRLVGELIDGLPDLPLLTVCVGRPEMTERDTAWVRALVGRDVVNVGALTTDDSAVLAASLATAVDDPNDVRAHDVDLVDQVTLYCAGNPLFIQLMLESVVPGQPVADTPPTITAMVGAMLDRMPEPARHLVGVASVVGPTFTLDDLALLAGPVPSADVDSLVERQIIRPTGEDGGFRFVQQPVHEVAYGRLEKEQRYAWHRRLAEQNIGPAFHFEAAARLLTDLRPDDAELPALSHQAAKALLREGTAALRQRDVPAAIELLRRAVTMVPDGQDKCRSVAAIRLSDALMLAGDSEGAVAAVADAVRRATDERGRLPCLIQQELLAVRLGRTDGVGVESLAVRLGADAADRLSWCRLEQLRMLLHLRSGFFGAAESAAAVALTHARAIGDAYEEDRLLAALCEVQQWSPTPVADKLAGCVELVKRFADDRFVQVPVLAAQARCLALLGDVSGAHDALAAARVAAEQLRLTMGRVVIDQASGVVHALAGAHAEAAGHYRAAADALERAGHAPAALTLRAQAVRELARLRPTGEVVADLAALWERRAEMDVRGQIACMSAAVRLADVGGTPLAAEEVLLMLDNTDDPCLRAEVQFDLAQRHRRMGDHAAAEAMANAAVDSYASVGATQPLQAVRSWM